MLGVCIECARSMKIAARGMCNSCYRNRHMKACRDCGQVRRHEADGRCFTCTQRHRRGVQPVMLASYFSPRAHTLLRARPVPLGPVECRALRDVALIVAGRKLPPPAAALPKARGARPGPTGMRGKGNGRHCLDCDRLGAKLRYGNRCAPCYRLAMAS